MHAFCKSLMSLNSAIQCYMDFFMSINCVRVGSLIFLHVFKKKNRNYNNYKYLNDSVE